MFMALYSGVVAQATSELLLPTDLQGIVKLNIGTVLTENEEIIHNEELTVFVKNEFDQYRLNAIQGHYKIEGEYLIFKPYFPLESGMKYIIRTRNVESNNTYSYQLFQIAEKKIPETRAVVGIYPAASRLPENLIRFYIYFNTPMKKGQALKHIQLKDKEGNIDTQAFMTFKQELWSADGKRLTILFDPGRIKRGVSTNVLRGPALLEGKNYELTISGAWEDVYGQPLSVSTIKKFEVISAYRQHIMVNNWLLSQPGLNSYDALTISVDRIFDHALIQSMINIVSAEENLISGDWRILEEERLLIFTPKNRWKKGAYQVIVDSRLEDVAGNNLQNLLDRQRSDGGGNSKTHHYLDFKIY